MKKFNEKKLIDEELDIGFDLLLSEKLGKDCFSILGLGLIEEHEHCGWCD